MPRTPTAPTEPWRNRIIEQGEIDPRRLTPNPDNWRMHPPAQRRALQGALATIGWVTYGALINVRIAENGWRPDECGEVMLDGHARRDEAIASGQPAIPYTKVCLTPHEERVVLATLDPISALAEGSAESYDRLISQIGPTDEALERLIAETRESIRAFDEAAAAHQEDDAPEAPDFDDDGEEEVDRAEELRVKHGVVPGQLWLIPSATEPGLTHTLLCGDATDPADARRALGGLRCALMPTDPPYNVGLDYGADVDDRQEPEAYRDFTAAWWAAWSPSCERAVVTPGGNNLGLWYALFGEQIRYVAPWTKTNATTRGIVSQYWCWEPIVFLDAQPGAKWPRERHSDVFEYPIGRQVQAGVGALTDLHQCPKGTKFWGDLVAHYSRRRDALAEPFSGSGTTLVVAEQLGRVVRACEKDPKSVAVALERLAKLGCEPRLADDGAGAVS